ncbi:hypothetical protein Tco_0199914 [Tanacetum coccineum]
MHPTTLIPYPRSTKIIVDHIHTENPDIPKRTNEPYHIVENNEVVKSIFNYEKKKGRGMRILEWLLIGEMNQTKNYKVYAADFQIEVPMTQSKLIKSTQETYKTPSSPRRMQLNPITHIQTAEHINVNEHLLDEDIEKIVEGDEESDANKFVDDMINSKEDLDTKIDLGSHKESLEVEKVVDYMAIDEEVEEELAKAALI